MSLSCRSDGSSATGVRRAQLRAALPEVGRAGACTSPPERHTGDHARPDDVLGGCAADGCAMPRTERAGAAGGDEGGCLRRHRAAASRASREARHRYGAAAPRNATIAARPLSGLCIAGNLQVSSAASARSQQDVAGQDAHGSALAAHRTRASREDHSARRDRERSWRPPSARSEPPRAETVGNAVAASATQRAASAAATASRSGVVGRPIRRLRVWLSSNRLPPREDAEHCASTWAKPAGTPICTSAAA